jgi:hypothetical protein
LWRQLTVEHLIGEGQGGYLREIKKALVARFPVMNVGEREELARHIDLANTVTACSFCNATTSRSRAPMSMTDSIAGAPDGPADVIFDHITKDLDRILESKRADVTWKLASVRAQFDHAVAPLLQKVRHASSSDR